MTKQCRKCRQTISTWPKDKELCFGCSNRDRYLRNSRLFTDEEVVAHLKGLGYVAGVAPRWERRFDLVLEDRTTSPPRYIHVRHLTRGHGGGVDLVVRGDLTGAIQFIPACLNRCKGCFKCRLAAALNGETAAEARERRHDPRWQRHKKVYIRAGKRITRNRLQPPCAATGVEVYVQVEDID